MGLRNKKAFTLVEILVASCVCVVLFYGAWQLFITMRKMNDISNWQSARQTELRVGLQRLREDLQQACYPSVITRRDSKRVGEDTHKLFYKDGGPFDLDSSSNFEILKFYVCQPCKKVGLGNDTDGFAALCILSAEGRSLRYKRTYEKVPDAAAAGIADDHPPAYNKVIINDVAQVNVECTEAASEEFDNWFCNVTVKCTHPKPGLKTQVIEQTGTKVEVTASTM